ncbi:hypothetical protein CDL12_06779 [Handroanthus impetiginosus]|uniref:Uncharacterized protein n=1 Tax=Handroanthus impetiginosus TaxID=429701 RepID=A0A2G9HSP7_9LAMI|nr:hypothetical protein CDL12_06779 [Handroanthus impetiginosus]
MITNTQKSAEEIASNEDLLILILLHLPVKSLLRFKCVSKQWLNLISIPFFSQKHSLKNHTSSTSGLFLYLCPSITYLSLEIQNSDSMPSFGPVSIFDFLKITPYATNLTILSSCNGLFLCLLVSPPWNDVIYFVSNPTTKKSTPLPLLKMLAKKPIVNMDLAFDPRESPHYKVICIRHLNPPDGPEFEIQIFSSETGSWRICQGPFLNISRGIRFRGGIYWNKGIHYLNSWGGNSFYFNVEEESLRTLPMPPMQSEVHTMKRSWYMGQSGGHLHLVDIQTNITRASCIDVYELLRDYSGWSVRYRVDLSAMESALPDMVQYFGSDSSMEESERIRLGKYYTFSVLSVVQKEGENIFELVLSIPKKIVTYNPRENASKLLVCFGDERDRVAYEWQNIIHYTETVSPI